MNLLLDEMISAAIAMQMRARDCDVEAVTEHAELRGLPDAEIFEHAQVTQRAVVTYNRDDFLALDRRFRSQARDHHGLVILHPKRFPQGISSNGTLTTALEKLISDGPPYTSFVLWLHR